jgi:hypothetical protein
MNAPMNAPMDAPRSLFTTPSRLLTHTRYVLQDYLLLRASIPIVMVSFFAWMIIRQTLKYTTAAQMADPRALLGMHQAYGSFSAVLLYFIAFLAVIAVMTVDRTTGYYRFFFSKPVNLVSYYLHTFCVHGAAICTVLVLFALAWGIWMPHESLHRASYAGVIAFALIGGLGFGFGALTNIDAALTPLAFVFAISAQLTLVDYTGPPRWLVITAKVLPPAADFEKTRKLLDAGRPFIDTPLWHVLGYGAAFWLLGLIFLRWRPLGR